MVTATTRVRKKKRKKRNTLPWTEADTIKFTKMWNEGKSTPRIAQAFRRRRAWVSGKSLALGLPKRKRGAYRAVKYDAAKLAEAWKRGDKLADIAKEFGSTTSWVSRTCTRKLGLPRRSIRNRELPNAAFVAAYQAGMTIKQIAAKCGVSPPSVRERLRDEGIELRKRHGPLPPVTPESMAQVKALLDQGLTRLEVGERLGKSRGWVDYRARNMNCAGKRPPRKDITPEKVLDLYKRECYSVKQIAEMFGCSCPTIRARLRKANAQNNDDQAR